MPLRQPNAVDRARAGLPGFCATGLFLCGCLLFASAAQAAEPDAVAIREQLRVGKYEDAATAAADAIERRAFGEEWYVLKAEADAAVGKYAAAVETLQAGLQRYSWSVRIRQAGIAPARLAGQAELAQTWITEIEKSVEQAPWRYTDAESLVAIGRTALMTGLDARAVLEQLYDRAQKQKPTLRDAVLATGQLALDKQDFELAADIFKKGTETHPNDPDLLWGASRALEQRDRPRSLGLLAQALQANPRHLPSLLSRTEQAIHAEDLKNATEFLDTAEKVNPHDPDVWSYRAVLATLANDDAAAKAAREKALAGWAKNPRVDWLIGRKLSQKYRFAEGAAHQEAALAFDEKYLPARIQLVQDWLRLGKSDAAWKLADAVHEVDGYDVHVFNLLELRDKLAKYATLERDGLRVRMEAKEAAVYGPDVLALLTRAKSVLCEKYGLTLTEPITVEIFPEPNDFAVRTFGLPGASGYLGVCFGKVITANSPASQAESPANWQAVLWHEFCHVVTLELTKNRMPRWLSEGISVYEERQADPCWGARMSPQFREWILTGKLTPLDEMSGAFLAPETPQHLVFAYFQASLVIEFLMERGGTPMLRKLLGDLATGLTGNDALERYYGPLNQLDAEFQEYARELARRFGPDIDWTQHDLSAVISNDDPESLVRWVADHPKSWLGLQALAHFQLKERNYSAAKKTLQQLVDLLPEYGGGDAADEGLALCHRELGDPANERLVLEAYVRKADAPVSALRRLMELQTTAEDSAALLETTARLRAVNPLLSGLHAPAARAAEKLQRWEEAIARWEAELALGPSDRAEVHFRLAGLYQERDPQAARLQVLLALERAPRYRAAQNLLWELVVPAVSAVDDLRNVGPQAKVAAP